MFEKLKQDSRPKVNEVPGNQFAIHSQPIDNSKVNGIRAGKEKSIKEQS